MSFHQPMNLNTLSAHLVTLSIMGKWKMQSKGKYGLEKVSLNRKFFTCFVILDHSFGLNVFK